jgi:hypothetical protein
MNVKDFMELIVADELQLQSVVKNSRVLLLFRL